MYLGAVNRKSSAVLNTNQIKGCSTSYCQTSEHSCDLYLTIVLTVGKKRAGNICRWQITAFFKKRFQNCLSVEADVLKFCVASEAKNGLGIKTAHQGLKPFICHSEHDFLLKQIFERQLN